MVLLGDLALGLFEDDSAVQRALQLLAQVLVPLRFAVLDDRDGGHVGQRLRDPHGARVQGVGVAVEQVQRPTECSRSRIGIA